MNKVNIKINGMEYNLKGEEREEYLQKVALYVDTKLKNIMENNSKLSLSSAAVLTAVNSVDDLFKCDLAYKDLCEEIELSEKKQKSQNDEIEDSKKKFKNIEKNNNELKEKIKNINLEAIYKNHNLEIEKCNLAYKDICEEKQLSEKKQKSQKDEIEDSRKQLKNIEEYNNELKEKIKSIDLEAIYKNHHLEIEKLNKEQEITIETAQKHISESIESMSENKELKFQLQSSKYKIISLQNKLVENQVDLAKIKKILNNPLKSK